MHILWSYLALFLLGRIEVLRGYDASAFGVLVDINRWKHSVWRSPLRMDYEAFQCHLRLLGAWTCLYVPINLPPDVERTEMRFRR
jgi:hypothetical protein